MALAHIAKINMHEKGATLVEFALIFPIFIMLLIGAFDIGHSIYMQAILQGSIQKAARDSTLETNTAVTRQTLIDDRVKEALSPLHDNATVRIDRRSYKSFEKAASARGEDFIDSNTNGVCDDKEVFQDDNGNGVWDSVGGSDGQGGAKDITIYTARVSYPRLFPIHLFIPALSDRIEISASTVLANQPYDEQTSPSTRECP